MLIKNHNIKIHQTMVLAKLGSRPKKNSLINLKTYRSEKMIKKLKISGYKKSHSD
jgi:hypothetical protein